MIGLKQKLLCVLMAAVCAAALFGCGEAQSEAGHLDGEEAPATISEEGMAEEAEYKSGFEDVDMSGNIPAAGNASYAGLTPVSGWDCTVGNVLYQVRDSWDLGQGESGEYRSWVTWLNAETGEMGYLCSLEGCGHSDESCPAWAGESWPQLLPMGDSLLLIGQNTERWDDEGENKLENLRGNVESLSLDGTTRERLAQLPADDFFSFVSFAVDGQKVYGEVWRDGATDDEYNKELGSIDIASGEYQKMEDMHWTVGVRGVLDGQLLVQRESGDGDEEKGEWSYSFELFLRDIGGGEEKMLLEWEDSEIMDYRVVDGQLYITDEKGTISRLAADGTQTELAKPDIPAGSDSVLSYIFGNYAGKLVVENSFYSQDGEWVDGGRGYMAYDLDSGAATTLTLTDGEGWNLRPQYQIGDYIYFCRDWSEQGSTYSVMPTADYVANVDSNIRDIT